MKNRERNHRIVFRLSDEELVYLENKLSALGTANREAYCRKMVLDGQLIQIDTSSIQEVQRLLSNVANNINQVAKRANETRSVHEADIQQIRKEHEKLRPTINQLETILLTLAK